MGGPLDVSRSNKLLDFANLLKSFIGTQYMTLSYGFLQSGVILGFVAIISVAVLTTHCCELIVKCKYYIIEDTLQRLRKQNQQEKDRKAQVDVELVRDAMTKRLNIVDIGQIVYGRVGSVLVTLCLLITQTGFCVGYHIFIGNVLWAMLFNPTVGVETPLYNISTDAVTLPASTALLNNSLSAALSSQNGQTASTSLPFQATDLSESTVPSSMSPVTTPAGSGDDWTSSFTSNTWLTILVVTPVPFFMLFTLFRRVRGIGPISMIANFVVALCFSLIVLYICLDFNLAEGIELMRWSTFAVMLGQAAASYEAVGTLLFIEGSMDGNHHNFASYLRTSILLFTLLFTPLALLGYLRYGLDTAQILLLDLPQDPLVMAVESCTVVGVILTYPIQVFPVTEMMEMFLFGKIKPSAIIDTDNRTSMSPDSDGLPLLGERDILEEIGVVAATVVPKTTANWKRNLLRLSIAILIAGLAVIFKNAFAYAGALVGAAGSTPLAFIFPCLFQLKLRYFTLSAGVKFKDMAIIVLCSILSVATIIVTLIEVSTLV